MLPAVIPLYAAGGRGTVVLAPTSLSELTMAHLPPGSPLYWRAPQTLNLSLGFYVSCKGVWTLLQQAKAMGICWIATLQHAQNTAAMLFEIIMLLMMRVLVYRVLLC